MEPLVTPDTTVPAKALDYSRAAIAKALTESLVTLQAELDRAVTHKATATKRVTLLRAELAETQRTLRAMKPRKRTPKEAAK